MVPSPPVSEEKTGIEIEARDDQLRPPCHKGMKVLDKSAFNKEIKVTTIVIPELNLTKTLRSLKPFFLKMKGIKAVQDCTEYPAFKRILLNPHLVPDVSKLIEKSPELQGIPGVLDSTSEQRITVTYDNWKWGDLIEAILPDDQDKFGGFTIVGRLVHVNLRDNLLPYKNIIGEIILDKVPNVRTVVNKLVTIDNTYRNFQMEVIAGDGETIVKVKENHVEFEFDFATVYWNSRLSEEHNRIVSGYLKKGDYLLDVFAGVGPFAIPAAKKKCIVLANDLNPESFKWLVQNITKNKVAQLVTAFNKDGRDFILEDISALLKSAILSNQLDKTFHVTMNLPAIAVTFLPCFWNLLGQVTDTGTEEQPVTTVNPDLDLVIHVYCFIKALDGHKDKALQLVKDELKYDLTSEQILDVFFVRNVAPNKDMYRVSFTLPHEILTSPAPTTLENHQEQAIGSRKRKPSNTDAKDD